MPSHFFCWLGSNGVHAAITQCNCAQCASKPHLLKSPRVHCEIMATKRQASLVEWCGRKKGRESSETESDILSPRLEDISASGEPSSSSTTTSVPSCSRPETDGEESDRDAEISVSNCTAMCCASDDKAYQPTTKQIISLFTSKGRNFQPQWYKQFTWLTVCTSSKKVYCLYC